MLLRCLVFFALLAGGTALVGQQHSPTKQSPSSSPTQQPIVVTLVAPPTQPWYIRPEWIGLIITGVYVVISGLTLLAIKRQGNLMAAQADSMSTQTERMGRQADLMNRQTRIAVESVRVTREAADAAKESADAAKTSAEVAVTQTKAMTNRERARLYVDMPSAPLNANIQRPSNRNVAGFQLNIRNVAPTAAINVRGHYSGLATEFQTPPEKPPQFPMEMHQVVEGQGSVESPILIFAAFAQGDARFTPSTFWCHVWGRIEYNDVLTEELHSTRFRFCIQMMLRPNGASSESEWQRCGMPEENQAS